MKFCPFCGQKVLPDTRFCQECGSVLTEQESQAVVKDEVPGEIVLSTDEPVKTGRSCKTCGTMATNDDIFCQECGGKLPAATGEPSGKDHGHEDNDAGKIHDASSLCHHCGAKLSPDNRFCEECGKPAGDEPFAPQPGPQQDEVAAETEKPQTVNIKVAEAPRIPLGSDEKHPHADEPAKKSVGTETAKPSGKRKLLLLLLFIILVIIGSATWYFMTKPSAKELMQADSTFSSDTLSKTQLSDSITGVADTAQILARALNKEINQEKTSGQRQPAQSSSASKTAPAATKTEILKSAQKNENRSAPSQTRTKHKSKVIFSNWNEQPVKNNPGREVKFEIDTLTVITRITTMHFNEGKGDPAGGTISIVGEKRLVYGVWKCETKKGDDGTLYAKWVCKPDVTLPPGKYRIINSGEKTWSFNKESGRRGLIIIEGYPK